jgi:hypothetical protein
VPAKRRPFHHDARDEFAEQIAVQIIHVRANEDSDSRPGTPDPTVSNDSEDLPRVRPTPSARYALVA